MNNIHLAGQPRRARRTHVLFIHQNFPGQFRNIALSLAQDRAYHVMAIGKRGSRTLPGMQSIVYDLHRTVADASHRYVKPYESAVLHGQAVLRVLLDLKEKQYSPDVIVGHPGWGETLFVKDAFPRAKLVHFAEYYYHSEGTDSGFDPEFPITLDDRTRIRAKNATLLMGLEHCDVAVAPTKWQKILHPTAYQSKLIVAHEGIDTDYICPDAHANFQLPSGLILNPGDPVVSYVARNLEPYRGFHVFLRMLPLLLTRHPDCHIVIAGDDGVSYGRPPTGALNWRKKLLQEVTVNPHRVHFVGKLAYADYRSLLQVSAAHVYLTYPFVLSWSMLESMAAGCVVIASNTAPVREVLRDGENGLLVDFFDTQAMAESVLAVLSTPSAFKELRMAARRAICDGFTIEHGVAAYRAIISAQMADAPNACRSLFSSDGL